MTRHEANKEILAKLFEYVEKAPDQRFGQILRNLGVVREHYLDGIPAFWANDFYIESEDTLNNIIKETK